MRNRFYEECGEDVKDYSDIELRFKAVASEIYAACTASDFALKQAFVQTATGDYLDKHAEMRGITRKQPEFAKGTLSFFVSEKLDFDVDIPKGTICSVKDNPLIQFATDFGAWLPAGSEGVSIPSTAISEGEEYNVPADSATVLVNPPEYVYSATNQNAFTGGADLETDESLRQRIIDSYGAALSNGVNSKSMEEQILTIEGIKDCSMNYDSKSKVLNIWISTANEYMPVTNYTDQVKEKLGILEICRVPYNLKKATKSEFSVFAAVKVSGGADKEKLLTDVKNAITEICSGHKIGSQINISTIMAAVIGVDNVELAEISAQPSYEGVIPCATGNYLYLNDVQVEIYE